MEHSRGLFIHKVVISVVISKLESKKVTLNTEIADTEDTIGQFTSKCYGTRVEDGK